MSLPSDQLASGRWSASASSFGAVSPMSSLMSADETDAAFALTALANAAAAMPQVSSLGVPTAATAAVTPSPPTVPTPTRLPDIHTQQRDQEMTAALAWAKTQTYIPNEAEESPVAKPAASPSASTKKSGGKKPAKKAAKGVPAVIKTSPKKSKSKTTSARKGPGDTIPLSLPTDGKHLSGSACILRQQIEVFSATLEDTMARGARHRPPVGAVGIRCIHCLHLPYNKRARGAVTFPSCIRLMYQGVRNFQRYHVPLCPYIPVETKQNLNKSYAAAGSKLSRHGTVDYWENSSRDQLGLVDTTVDQKEAVFFRDSF